MHQKLTTGTLEVQKGGKMTGNIEHTGGKFISNGVQVDDHAHGNVQSGGAGLRGHNDGALSRYEQPDRAQCF